MYYLTCEPYSIYTIPYTQGYCGGILHDGQYMVNYTDIILVTINYRLGALGFLVYGSNLEIGGNYGLKVLHTHTNTHTHVYMYAVYKRIVNQYFCGSLILWIL